jgi:hypothetical protein
LNVQFLTKTVADFILFNHPNLFLKSHGVKNPSPSFDKDLGAKSLLHGL